MEIDRAISGKGKGRILHSLSLKDVDNDNNVGEDLLGGCKVLEPLTPSNRLAEQSIKTPNFLPKLENKKKEFLEMIGVPRSKDIVSKTPGLKLDLNTHKISLTDFMGKNKQVLIQKSGCYQYYDEYLKNKEFQKLINKKKVVSYSNIKHTDKVREFKIMNPKTQRTVAISPLFDKPKYIKRRQQIRLDVIQEIIDKCDGLFHEMKEKSNTGHKIKKNVFKGKSY